MLSYTGTGRKWGILNHIRKSHWNGIFGGFLLLPLHDSPIFLHWTIPDLDANMTRRRKKPAIYWLARVKSDRK
jgi:hypothetical protein